MSRLSRWPLLFYFWCFRRRHQRLLLTLLYHVRDPEQRYQGLGICYNVGKRIASERVHIAVQYELVRLIRTWPLYNGNPLYPIGAPAEAERLFHSEPLWSTTYPYGRLRHELLAYLITTLEKRFGYPPATPPADHEPYSAALGT